MYSSMFLLNISQPEKQTASKENKKNETNFWKFNLHFFIAIPIRIYKGGGI